MNKPTIVEIPEYHACVLSLCEEKDIPYLDKDCFKHKSSSTFKVRKQRNEKVEIENTSYSGIIQLDSIRIHFSTKVKSNLFYMLSSLRDESAFKYDPDTIIAVKEGLSFYDILGRLYLNELEAIYKKGFFKKYVRKEEDKRYLRGKLILKEQLKNSMNKKVGFYCAYADLTYDNLENQIILKAITLLIPMIRFNERIKKDLIMYRLIMNELVSLVNRTPEDCERVQFNRLNEHYETIISFSKLILRHHFIRSIRKGQAFGFNFVVNMNRVYEDFIAEILEEIVCEDKAFNDYVIEKQKKFNSLVKERAIVTKPDVLLRKRDTNTYPLIIDAKYKTRESNADYYQVIAYALALPGVERCCLIYPDDPDIEAPPVLTLNTKPLKQDGREVTIHTLKIDLHLDEDLPYADYIKAIKTDMLENLRRCIGDQNTVL